jgi:chromosome segregation ATPase
MLKRIEIKNFESHKHTVIDDLSDGLNLVRGESNAGKTSIVRALKLAAYNDYDPKSLRTGETKCEVTVTTDKGTVKVVRGPKINFWEVTPLGQPPIAFDKVGKSIIPEAARVIGLNVVRLGDADIPANIMDQLESHFMLASLGSQDASGSLRAQVIDEISGLSGIEGVIKAVSLDNHRFGREISETETKMNEAQAQLHDERALNAEDALLKQVETDLTDHDEMLKAAVDAETLMTDYNKTAQAAEDVEVKLAALPDLEEADALLKAAKENLDGASLAEAVHESVTKMEATAAGVQTKLDALPDITDADKMLGLAKKSLDMATEMGKLLTDYQMVAKKANELNAEIEAVEQMGDLSGHIGAAQKALDELQKAEAMLEGLTELQDQMDALEARLKVNREAMLKAVDERDAVLAQVKVCPLTLEPVSPDCIQKART